MQYKITDRMADIISDNPYMLQILSRFGMKLGFGDATVEQLCASQGIDAPTFISVINFVAEEQEQILPKEEISKLSVPTLLYFLKQAHIYFIDFALPEIKEKLNKAIGSYQDEVSRLIMIFFENYTKQVRQHMNYEERDVFPFVEQLLQKGENKEFTIDSFSEKHNEVSATLNELKELIIKYFPAKESSNLVNSVLYDIMICEKELASHCKIEDFLFVPSVRLLENPRKFDELYGRSASLLENEEGEESLFGAVEEGQELSSRELDILKEVAKGFTNKEIADNLFISIHTVITHRRNITRKLKIHSVAGLTIYAVANRLIDIKDVEKFLV